MRITRDTLRTGQGYAISESNEYEVKEGCRFKLQRATPRLAMELQAATLEKSELGNSSFRDTIELIRTVVVAPEGWDWDTDPWDDDVEFGMFSRMLQDFLLPPNGVYRRPSAS